MSKRWLRRRRRKLDSLERKKDKDVPDFSHKFSPLSRSRKSCRKRTCAHAQDLEKELPNLSLTESKMQENMINTSLASSKRTLLLKVFSKTNFKDISKTVTTKSFPKKSLRYLLDSLFKTIRLTKLCLPLMSNPCHSNQLISRSPHSLRVKPITKSGNKPPKPATNCHLPKLHSLLIQLKMTTKRARVRPHEQQTDHEITYDFYLSYAIKHF